MKKMLIVITALALFSISAVCSAAPARPGVYVSGFVGISAINDTSVTTDPYLDIPVYRDRVEFDPGLFIGGTGGYDFGFIRVEGELSYKYADIKSIHDQTNGFRFYDSDGNIGALAMMFNTFLDLHNDSPVTPYLGGGIGFASLHMSDTFGTDPTDGQRSLLYADDDATVFAYQIGAGLEFAINRKLSLDLGYRYFATDTATFDSDPERTVNLKLESHNVAIGFRIRF